jgi:hypothetical protein
MCAVGEGRSEKMHRFRLSVIPVSPIQGVKQPSEGGDTPVETSQTENAVFGVKRLKISENRAKGDSRMIKTARIIFAILLIISLLGIGICDFCNKDYKTFVLGVLFSAANIVIFLL